jgi:hypothetical protein
MATMRLPDDFSEFLRLLTVHEVEYLLVGGYAVAVHGYPRATADLDVWVAPTRTNAERLVTVLRTFGFDQPEITPDLFLDPERLIRMGLPPMRLEVLTSISGDVPFDEASERAEIIVIDDIEVPVLSLADLRRNKAAAGRAKDLADLEALPEA